VNALEIAQVIGTVLGSGVASWFTAKAFVKKNADAAASPSPSPEARPQLPSFGDQTLPSAPGEILNMQAEIAALRKRIAEAETDLVELSRTAKAALDAANSALTIEEFEAYTSMDSERRERVIASVGELRGRLDLVLERM